MERDSHELETNKAVEAGSPTYLPNDNSGHSSDDANSNEKQPQSHSQTQNTTTQEEEKEYLTGLRLFLVIFTICVSGILTALEIGIISTAIPAITDQFHSLSDVGWYGSATFLVVGASSAMWGKMYKYLNVKWVYLVSIGIFLVGSIVAAAAPNSSSIIVGRALQGFGISGTMSGSIIVINYVAHPKSHPVLIGTWTGIFMVSTVLGPVIGGAFTSGVSWRWCFWINLPLGGPILVLLFLFLRVPKHVKPAPASWKEIILQLDLPGFAFMLASLVCLTLALQWGGQSKAWSDGSVIATLVLWIVFAIVFVVIEHFQKDRAMVPLRLMKPRTTWANVLYSFVANAAFYQVMFYLPIYFQSIKGKSAIISGVDTLPFLAFFGVGAMTSGTLVGKLRLLQPFELASGLLVTAGMGLIYAMEVDTSESWYFGAEVLFGFGAGLGNQVPMMAVQGLSKPEDVPSSTAIMFTAQAGSAAYFIVIAQSIFANRLVVALTTESPDIDAARILAVGASELHQQLSGTELTAVLQAYMEGIKDVFACALAAAALCVLLSLVIPFKRLPDHSDETKKENKEEVA